MYLLKIAAYGDNKHLHGLALQQAVEAVERVNGAPVYRAWVERIEDIEAAKASIPTAR